MKMYSILIYAVFTFVSMKSICQDNLGLKESVYENNFIKYLAENKSDFHISDSCILYIDTITSQYPFCSQINNFKWKIDLEDGVDCNSVIYSSNRILKIDDAIRQNKYVTLRTRDEIKENVPQFDFLSVFFSNRIFYKDNIFLFVKATSFSNTSRMFLVRLDLNGNVVNCYFMMGIE